MGHRLEVTAVGPRDRRLVAEFTELPFRLYRGCPQWVPMFRCDMRALLQRRHPFFRHSSAEFFLVMRGDAAAGSIAVLDNAPYNRCHASRIAHFYLFECIDDEEAACLLFESAKSWAVHRGLAILEGPSGFGSMAGGGILIEGFEHRAAMTMMGYHHSYYPRLVEKAGLVKFKDQYSAFLDTRTFVLPERVRRAAEITIKRGHFRVPSFRGKKEVLAHARKLGEVYNRAFASHDTFMPIGEEEIGQIARELLLVSDPGLIKLLFYGDELAGFLFAFPDLSAALQRAHGRLTPLAMADLAWEKRRTRQAIINGAGILPEYQRLGGNALLYYELERIGRSRRFLSADLTQIAETTELMLSDLKTLGVRIYKTHRVYRCALPGRSTA